MNKKICIAVGIKDFCGMWEIMDVVVDFPNVKAPYYVSWPNGIKGKIMKVTESGRYLYERIK